MKLKREVLEWAKAKGILDRATPMAQAIKTLEEVNELLAAINSGNDEEREDAYGDILVTIIIGAELSGLDIEDCLEKAYNVIKSRTGKMVNGQFVKDKAPEVTITIEGGIIQSASGGSVKVIDLDYDGVDLEADDLQQMENGTTAWVYNIESSESR